MDRPSLSLYDYLTFLIPGALVLSAVVYGWVGWPFGEPGAGGIIGLSVAAFVVGHAIAAFANFFQALWFGQRPGIRLASSEGLFERSGRYGSERNRVLEVFAAVHSDMETFDAQFGLAYANAQAGPLGPKLQTLIEQIGFYRSMATASALSFIVVTIFNLLGRHHLPALLWIPILLSATALYAYRFRRFWRYLGEYVVADVFRRLNADDN